MPTGSFSFDPYGVPLGRAAAQFLVFRFVKGDLPSNSAYYPLPNLRCEGIHPREGAEPGSADFRYSFDPYLNDPAAPLHIEQVYPLAARGPYTVHHDDRLVVGWLRADGSLQLVFDGFAQIPQANLSDTAELVAFQAIGVPCREWDTPIGGAVYRSADNPNVVKDVETDLPTNFNEDLEANATDEGHDSGFASTSYPVFLDPLVCKARGIGRKWTLGMAVRYLIMQGNPVGEWVDYPAFVVSGVPVLENALSAVRPAEGATAIDWTDASTYTLEPILAPDFPATGKAWPEAVEDLIVPHGFGLAFRLAADADGFPAWTLEIYRKDNPYRIKSLALQPYGTAMLDPGQSNVQQVRLQRDVSQLANEWTVDTHPVRHEASFVLAPAFTPANADAARPDNKTLPQFVDTHDPATFDPVKYRDYVFDETGDGHWDFPGSTFVTGKATSFDDVLGKGNYAARRRPGLGTLISTDAQGKELKAELWVSKDYNGDIPGVWNRKGTWQKATKGEWALMKDRLGIHLTVQDPQNWQLGPDDGAGKPYKTGKVRVIDSQTIGDPVDTDEPVFRLTCVIEGDLDIEATAEKRLVSPTKFTIRRHDDARDRFRLEQISVRSHLNASGKNQVQRDDTAKAQAHVEARRRVHETARFSGSVTIPRFTTAYRIGDRLRIIAGRNIDLRTNLGADQGESAEYPAIVGIDWETGPDHQSTTLLLSDRRVEGPTVARTL